MSNELTLKTNELNVSKFVESLKFWKKRLIELNELSEKDPKALCTESGLEENPASWLLRNVNSNVYSVQRIVKSLENEMSLVMSIHKVNSTFMQIGYILSTYDTDVSIPVFGANEYKFKYISFAEFCETHLGIKKSTAYNLRLLYEKFGCNNGQIREAYKSYSYSQLCEMLPLSLSEQKKVNPGMSVKDIRELKKTVKDEKIKEREKESSTPPPEVVTVEEIATPEKANNVLLLKNDKQRAEWICNYEKNGYLWIHIPQLYMKVYRYDFKNGDSLFVTRSGKGSTGVYKSEDYCSTHYQIVGKGTAYSLWANSNHYNQVVEYLKKYKESI